MISLDFPRHFVSGPYQRNCGRNVGNLTEAETIQMPKPATLYRDIRRVRRRANPAAIVPQEDDRLFNIPDEYRMYN